MNRTKTKLVQGGIADHRNAIPAASAAGADRQPVSRLRTGLKPCSPEVIRAKALSIGRSAAIGVTSFLD